MTEPIVVQLTGPPGPHRVRVDPAVLTAERQPGLVDQLAAGKLDFQRPAAPAVYAEYLLFVASGRYPYLDSIEAEILARYPAIGVDLHEQLRREVYLASGQYRVGQMVAAEQAALADGWRPITQLEPAAGKRIEVLGLKDNPLRVHRGNRDDWVLIPHRRRTHGYRLKDLTDKHQAYDLAKAENQTRMNGPGVVMFREVQR